MSFYIYKPRCVDCQGETVRARRRFWQTGLIPFAIQSGERRQTAAQQTAWAIILGAAIFALNVWLILPLFQLQWSALLMSAEGVFISISRYMIENWRDLRWWPLWYDGIPEVQTYPPLLHVLVALWAVVFRTSPAHAHHVVTGLFYCLGPLSLGCLCLYLTGSRWRAFFCGLAYCVVSPAAIAIPWVRANIGGALRPWRITTLLEYGDSPHIVALALIPLALIALDVALRRRTPGRYAVAAIACAAVVLTNWIGAYSLAIATLLYLLATTQCWSDFSNWLRVGCIAAAAYTVASPWMPPGMVLLIARNSAFLQEEFRKSAAGAPLRFLVAALLLGVAKWICERLLVSAQAQFAIYLCVFLGGIPIVSEYLHIHLMPMPHRYQLEFDLAVCLLSAMTIGLLLARLPKGFTFGAVAIALVCAAVQIRTCKNFDTALIQPVAIEGTVEYRIAKWLDANIGQGRAYAQGSVCLWLNAFNDVPQSSGEATQDVPSFATWLATQAGYAGRDTDPNGKLALLWLRAFGVDMAVVNGPHSSDYFRMYPYPEKYDLIAEKVWAGDGDAIYRIPRRSRSLAHVLQPSDLVRHTPVRVDDTGELRTYVDGLENASLPVATFAWKNRHEGIIDASLTPEQVISVQVSYHPGWRAKVGGATRVTRADGLGLLVIEPKCSGPCEVTLSFDGSWEERLARWASAAVILAFAVWAWSRRRLPRAADAR